MNEIPSVINNELVGFDYKLNIRFLYDVTTKNRSFLQTSKDLEYLGVTNNKFFLKLYDPQLQGVDPYDPLITNDQIKRIIIECVRNPWYYLREIARIPESGSAQGPGSGSKFLLHRANLAAIYCYLNNIDLYLVIPRQCGKTQSMISIFLWTYIFGTTNSVITFNNKSQGDANDNLARLKAQRDLLPVYLQQKFQFNDGESKTAKGTDNVQRITNPINNNVIVTKPSAKTIEAAENIGRGNTSPIQFYDEVEFASHIGYILAASGPAYVQAARNARKNNAPYCRVLITTPGNVDSGPVEETVSTRNMATMWTDKLLDLSTLELFTYLNRNSKTKMFYIEYFYYQIGKDEAWYQEQCRVLEYNKIRIKREIHLQRIRGSNDSPFDAEDLDTINGLKKPVLEEVLLNKIFSVRLYEKINTNIPYIVSVDVSTGTNNDNTAISIIDPYKEQAVGEFKSPLIGTIDICTLIRLIVKKICPKAIICIERNSLGDAVIEMLKKTEVSYNLYYDTDAFLVGNPDEKLDEKGFIKREAINRKSYGVHTNGKSREIMMAILMRLVVEKKSCFATEYIIHDLNNLIRKASGKIEARSGEHDDNIMSFLIGMYVLYHGKNLIKWGFKRGSTPLDAETLKPMSYEEIYGEMSKEMQEMFPAPSKDNYEQLLKNAIFENQRSRQNFSETANAIVTSDDQLDMDYNAMMDGDDDLSDEELNFFDDINKY